MQEACTGGAVLAVRWGKGSRGAGGGDSDCVVPANCCPVCVAVPSAPPRKVEVESVNSTAIRVSWKLPISNKQHGQIRGYQVTYVKLENNEPRGQPVIKDVMLSEAQVQCGDHLMVGMAPSLCRGQAGWILLFLGLLLQFQNMGLSLPEKGKQFLFKLWLKHG